MALVHTTLKLLRTLAEGSLRAKFLCVTMLRFVAHLHDIQRHFVLHHQRCYSRKSFNFLVIYSIFKHSVFCCVCLCCFCSQLHLLSICLPFVTSKRSRVLRTGGLRGVLSALLFVFKLASQSPSNSMKNERKQAVNLVLANRSQNLSFWGFSGL